MTTKRLLRDELQREKTRDRNKKIFELVLQGKSYQQVANIYKISRQRIHQIYVKTAKLYE